MMTGARIFTLVLALFSVMMPALADSPEARWPGKEDYVTSSDGKLWQYGEEFRFLGVNAYWLPVLNSDQDIINTLGNISAVGAKVIRLWAFNDVDEIPANNSVWFQTYNAENKTFTINNGTNGLQRLDKVIGYAEQAGLSVYLTLTNNWNPVTNFTNYNGTYNGTSSALRARAGGAAAPPTLLPRNYLSNEYGGMDFYVRHLSRHGYHDEFYTNKTIIEAFHNYTKAVVSRYANNSTVFGWEIANDPRCNSTNPASKQCTAQTVTRWLNDVGKFIKTLDSNHLVAAGDQGFFCIGCPKLFPQIPPAQSSPTAKKKRTVKSIENTVLQKRKENRQLKAREAVGKGNFQTFRGRWFAPRQAEAAEQALGSAFDGAWGVDSQDISNAPNIDLLTFQLLPQQNQYSSGQLDSTGESPNSLTAEGSTWIQTQSQINPNKPSILTSFGLVTLNNSLSFVPFNQSHATTASTAISRRQSSSQGLSAYTAQEQQLAYSDWIQLLDSQGISGGLLYQWGQSNLSSNVESPIQPGSSGSQGLSPNDGYATSPTDSDGIKTLLSSLADLF